MITLPRVGSGPPSVDLDIHVYIRDPKMPGHTRVYPGIPVTQEDPGPRCTCVSGPPLSRADPGPGFTRVPGVPATRETWDPGIGCIQASGRPETRAHPGIPGPMTGTLLSLRRVEYVIRCSSWAAARPLTSGARTVGVPEDGRQCDRILPFAPPGRARNSSKIGPGGPALAPPPTLPGLFGGSTNWAPDQQAEVGD